MAYSFETHSYPSKKHDSFLQPSSHDVYGYSRHSRSSSRLDPNVTSTPSMTRNKSSHGHERRPHYYDDDYRSRSSTNREETYPTFSRRSRSHRRPTWPPEPVVEDEVVALAKEYPRSKPRRYSDEGVMPGAVDQTPVLIELESHDRRYVIVPEGDEKSKKESDLREEDGSFGRKDLKTDHRPPLTLDMEKLNLFARRQPSPYAFTRTPQTTSNRSSGEFVLSPEFITPRSALNPKPAREHRRGGRSGGSSDSDYRTDDSDLEPAQISKLRERKLGQGPRVSFTEPTLSSRERPELKRFSSDYSNQPELRKAPVNQSSSLKSSMKPPRSVPSDEDKPTKSSAKSPSKPQGTMPVPIPLPHHIRAESVYTSRPSLNEFADPSSRNETAWIPTPPGSPKYSGPYNPAKRTSRPSSPAISDSPTGSYRNSRGFPDANPEYNARGILEQNRLPSTVRHASLERPMYPRIDVQSPSPAPPQRPVLPYPIDEPEVHMPNFEHFQSPVTQSGPSIKSLFDSIPKSPQTSPRQRPSIPTRNVTPDGIPELRGLGIQPPGGAKPSLENKVLDSFIPPVDLPTKLPTCPRKEYSKKYNDWYTLRGDDSFDICPTCLDEIIWPTGFGKHFVEQPLRVSTVRTRCDFGSPWVRLAWLLTLKRQRQDLDLIYALSAITTSEADCPDSQESFGPWFGLKDQSGQIIPNFALCSRDVKHVETLFPSLIGVFVRISPSMSGPQPLFCSLRLSSKQFPMYLDLLEDIDDDARSKPGRPNPNLQTLIEVVRAHTYEKTCPRDNPTIDSTWHFIPGLPEFTVCEECYDDVIWPSTKVGSDIANKVTRVLEPLPPGKSFMDASCQLYSPRMRRVWERAVKYGDEEGMRYLARKVKERREVEDDLRGQQVEIGMLLDRAAKSSGPSAGVDKERLKRELDRIAKEWEDWE